MQWIRGQWDRVGAWVLIGAGALALMLGWLGVRSEALTQKQIPYIISGGIGGILLVGLGAMLWLSADLRDEWRKLDAIERQLASQKPVALDDPFVDSTDTATATPEANGATNGQGKQSRPSRSRRRVRHVPS